MPGPHQKEYEEWLAAQGGPVYLSHTGDEEHGYIIFLDLGNEANNLVYMGVEDPRLARFLHGDGVQIVIPAEERDAWNRMVYNVNAINGGAALPLFYPDNPALVVDAARLAEAIANVPMDHTYIATVRENLAAIPAIAAQPAVQRLVTGQVTQEAPATVILNLAPQAFSFERDPGMYDDITPDMIDGIPPELEAMVRDYAAFLNAAGGSIRIEVVNDPAATGTNVVHVVGYHGGPDLNGFARTPILHTNTGEFSAFYNIDPWFSRRQELLDAGVTEADMQAVFDAVMARDYARLDFSAMQHGDLLQAYAYDLISYKGLVVEEIFHALTGTMDSYIATGFAQDPSLSFDARISAFGLSTTSVDNPHFYLLQGYFTPLDAYILHRLGYAGDLNPIRVGTIDPQALINDPDFEPFVRDWIQHQVANRHMVENMRRQSARVVNRESPFPFMVAPEDHAFQGGPGPDYINGYSAEGCSVSGVVLDMMRRDVGVITCFMNGQLRAIDTGGGGGVVFAAPGDQTIAFGAQAPDQPYLLVFPEAPTGNIVISTADHPDIRIALAYHETVQVSEVTTEGDDVTIRFSTGGGITYLGGLPYLQRGEGITGFQYGFSRVAEALSAGEDFDPLSAESWNAIIHRMTSVARRDAAQQAISSQVRMIVDVMGASYWWHDAQAAMVDSPDMEGCRVPAFWQEHAEHFEEALRSYHTLYTGRIANKEEALTHLGNIAHALNHYAEDMDNPAPADAAWTLYHLVETDQIAYTELNLQNMHDAMYGIFRADYAPEPEFPETTEEFFCEPGTGTATNLTGQQPRGDRFYQQMAAAHPMGDSPAYALMMSLSILIPALLRLAGHGHHQGRRSPHEVDGRLLHSVQGTQMYTTLHDDTDARPDVVVFPATDESRALMEHQGSLLAEQGVAVNLVHSHDLGGGKGQWYQLTLPTEAKALLQSVLEEFGLRGPRIATV